MVRRRSLVLLIAADACWVGVTVRLALALDGWRRSLPDAALGLPQFAQMLTLVAIWLLALALCGAYEPRYLALRGRNLSLTMCGSAAATATCAVVFYLVPAWHTSRLSFLCLGLAGGVGLTCIRETWLSRRRGAYRSQFLGVGDPEMLSRVWKELAVALGTDAALPVVSAADALEPPAGIRLCPRESALDALNRHGPNIVVLSDGVLPSAEAASILTLASFAGSTVADIFTFYETCTGRAPVFRTEDAWVFRAQHRAPDALAYLRKRLSDLLLTALLLPAAVVIGAVAAALAKLTSPGPVFFVQRRIGFRGREFSLFKLRTMRIDRVQEDGAWTQRDDPRVTPLGRVLRTAGLDELPQLWNVLRGDLSLVGPRPEQPEVVARLCESLPPYMQRHVVPCGITGWAQIHRGGDAGLDDVLDKVRLDLYYARHFSLWLDALILLRTFQMLLARAKPAPSALVPRAADTRPASRAVSYAAGGPGG